MCTWGTRRTETDASPSQAAARTLAGFLLDVKGCEPEQLSRWLPATETWRGLDEPERAALLQSWLDAPPFLMEFPLLHPTDAASDMLLRDLAELAALAPPWDPAMEQAAVSIAVYLKRDPQQYAATLGKRLVQALAQRTTAALPRAITADVARALLNILQEDLPAYAVLHPVLPVWGEAAAAEAPQDGGAARQLQMAGEAKQLWLLGYQQGLVVVEVGLAPRVVWTADFADVQVETSSGWLGGRIELQGGTWRIAFGGGQAPPQWMLQRSLLNHRKPWDILLKHLSQ